MGKRSEDIRRRRQRVLAFGNGLVELLNRCERFDDYFGNDVWQPKRGMEADVQQRASELERLTQPAALVVQDCGILVDFKPAGTWQTQPLNPVLAWSTLFSKPVIDADLIVSSCDRAIGALDAAIEEAEAHEGTAAGRIEHRLDGPRGIWRAVGGAPRNARENPSAVWTGIVIGIVVAVIGGGILYWLGWN